MTAVADAAGDFTRQGAGSAADFQDPKARAQGKGVGDREQSGRQPAGHGRQPALPRRKLMMPEKSVPPWPIASNSA